MSRAARQHGSVLRPALSALLSTSAPGHFAKDLLPVCSTLPALCNAVAAPHARRSLLRDTHKSPRSARTAPHPDAQQQRVSVAPSSHTQLIADIDRKAASHLRGATYTHRLSCACGLIMLACLLGRPRPCTLVERLAAVGVVAQPERLQVKWAGKEGSSSAC